MAHGNFSDLIFLCLLLMAVQWFAYPDTLFIDFGPFKAQFSQNSTNMDRIIKFTSGLFLMIGMVFSGVKWNEKNGKMAGMGGFIAAFHTVYSAIMSGSGLQLFHVYALVFLAGSLHIFKFPGNKIPTILPGAEEPKNNHGNFSDGIFLALFVSSMSCFFFPQYLFSDFGPFKAQFDGDHGSDLDMVIGLIASLFLWLAMIFSGIKWNPVNGKMAGIGGFLASLHAAYTNFTADDYVFELQMFYIFALIIFAGSVHIFAFPSNPKLPKEEPLITK